MNIVCIAWGSLLWKPAPLRLASGWHPDGPRLPLEFVRDSDDSAEVALVLCEGAAPMPTYWAYLDTDDLDIARAMLDALEPEQRAQAEEYVRRTPAHIDTCYRRLIAARLGWTPDRDAHVTRMR